MIQLFFFVFFFSKSAVVDSVGRTRIPLCDSMMMSLVNAACKEMCPQKSLSLSAMDALSLSLYLYAWCVPRKTRPPLSDHKHSHNHHSRRRRYSHHHRHHQRRQVLVVRVWVSLSLSSFLCRLSNVFWRTKRKKRRKKKWFLNPKHILGDGVRV